MKLADYDALIGRLERLAQDSPAAYRSRVYLFTALGYSVVGLTLLAGVLLLLAGALVIWFGAGSKAGAGAVKLGLVIAGTGGWLVWAVLRGVWVRFPPPDGVRLTRAEAPELHDEIDRTCQSLGIARIHAIVIDQSYNAALAQLPRLGVFGWYRNVLVLGLPLLRHLTPEQARGVIAHELGHLQGHHGRVATWIVRLRATWAAIAARSANAFARAFLRWYAPRFDAYTFVLARAHEREADRASMQLVGGECAGIALARTAVGGRQAGRFLGGLNRLAVRQAEPPPDLPDRIARDLTVPAPESTRWLDEELHRSNNRSDPHPCLRERLELMTAAPAARSPMVLGVVPATASAAAMWLRSQEKTCAERLGAEWATGVAAQWHDRHRHAQELRRRLEELDTEVATGAADDKQLWQRAAIRHDLDGPAAARPAIEDVLKRNPHHAPALFQLGQDLLEVSDPRGVPLIERAMELDDDATGPGCDLLRDFADRQGRPELIARAESRGEARAELETKAAEERNRLPRPRDLLPHGLTDAELKPLRAVLAEQPDLAHADLARVAVKHLPERPFFTLVVRIKRPWWKFQSAEKDQPVLDAVAQANVLPGTYLVINGREKTAALAKAVAKQSGARIF